MLNGASPMQNLLTLYFDFWKKAFDFKGRINRSQYIWTAVVASLPFVIWLLISFQWYLDYIATQVEQGNYLFPLPPGVYLFGAANLIPAIALNCRRLVDAGVDRRWLLAYFVTSIGSMWVSCLVLKPSFDQDQSKLIASKAFARRSSSNTPLIVSSFLFPPSSLFFGIRRRSLEIALMPIAGAGFVSNFVKVEKYLGGIEINKGITYLASGFVASVVMYFVDKQVRKTSALLAK